MFPTSRNNFVASLKNSVRNVTTDKFYSDIGPCEGLLDDNMTYVVTSYRHGSSTPPPRRRQEGRLGKSTIFYWSDGIMLVSYTKRKRKNVLIMSLQQMEPLVTTGRHSNESATDWCTDGLLRSSEALTSFEN